MRNNRLWAVGEDCLIASKSKPIDRPIHLSDQTIILYKDSGGAADLVRRHLIGAQIRELRRGQNAHDDRSFRRTVHIAILQYWHGLEGY